jgi:hypothetical protein
VRRCRSAHVGALGAYCLLSFLYFGLPVAAHPGRMVVGSDNDPKDFIWFLAWWPHAIVHGQNPIFTHEVWAPTGYDLAWTVPVPGLALPLAPLTALAGPVVAFNTAMILMPALAAWTAFLLCRYMCKAFWPSLAGGCLFGFSSYFLGHEEGHLNLTAVFPVPLVALVALRHMDGRIGSRRLALSLGLLLAAQFSLSTEVTATLTLALLGSCAIAFGTVPSVRGRIRSLVAPVAAGYAIAAVLVSPLLYYVVTDFTSGLLGPTGQFVTDAANLVVPTQTTGLGGGAAVGISAHFHGNVLEQTAYFGIPMLVILGLYIAGRRRQPGARFLIASFVAAILGSFGSWLHVYGFRTIPLPWIAVARLPVFNNIYPARLTLYATLAGAVTVALWAASHDTPVYLRFVLPALAVVILAPSLGHHYWDEKLHVPAFFADGYYKKCFTPGENVIVIRADYMGSSTLWQALSGFRFRLEGGELGDQQPLWGGTTGIRLLHDDIRPGDGFTLLALARARGVGTILVDPADPYPWSSVLAPIGRPISVGGVLLYRVRPEPAAISAACASVQGRVTRGKPEPKSGSGLRAGAHQHRRISATFA